MVVIFQNPDCFQPSGDPSVELVTSSLWWPSLETQFDWLRERFESLFGSIICLEWMENISSYYNQNQSFTKITNLMSHKSDTAALHNKREFSQSLIALSSRILLEKLKKNVNMHDVLVVCLSKYSLNHVLQFIWIIDTITFKVVEKFVHILKFDIGRNRSLRFVLAQPFPFVLMITRLYTCDVIVHCTSDKYQKWLVW